MLRLSDRVNAIADAATGKAVQAARAKLEIRGNLIEMARGEPHFEVPENIRTAIKDALDREQTHYTAVDGTEELKNAIRDKFARENGLDFSPSEITVGSGCKQVIANALAATLDPGDEVIIPLPAWDCYANIVRFYGGVPVFAQCSARDGFKLRPEELLKSITSRTRWLILNSPSNPTGAVYSVEEQQKLIDVLFLHPEVWLLSDEIYEHMVYEGKAVSPLYIAPSLRERTLIANGLSKTYAMTGLRIGFGAGPTSLIKAMAKVQSNSTSNPCSSSQAGAVEALRGPQHFLKERLNILRAARDLVIHGLEEVEGLFVAAPQASFFAFVCCEGKFGKRTPDGRHLEDGNDFVAALLENEQVLVTPGSAFGDGRYFRMTFSLPEEQLRIACNRISRFCASLT